MKRLLPLGLPILAILLVSLTTSAITSSQIGANSIVCTYNNPLIAGVGYSDEWFSTIIHGWNPIIDAQEYIYVANTSFTVNSGTIPNVIFVGVGLSPDAIGYYGGATGGPGTSTNILEAGFLIEASSSSQAPQYALYYNEIINNQSVSSKIYSLPYGYQYTILFVYLQNFGNGTAQIIWDVYYNGGSLYYTTYIPWEYSNNRNAYSAYSLVGAVEGENALGEKFLYTMPIVAGGLTYSFKFAYISNNNEYIGPGTPASGTDFEAIVYSITPSSYNPTSVALYNAWGSTGSWNYVYNFDGIIKGL